MFKNLTPERADAIRAAVVQTLLGAHALRRPGINWKGGQASYPLRVDSSGDFSWEGKAMRVGVLIGLSLPTKASIFRP